MPSFPADSAGGEKYGANFWAALVHGERRHLGVAACIEVGDAGRHLDGLRRIGFGTLRRGDGRQRERRERESDSASSGKGNTQHVWRQCGWDRCEHDVPAREDVAAVAAAAITPGSIVRPTAMPGSVHVATA